MTTGPHQVLVPAGGLTCPDVTCGSVSSMTREKTLPSHYRPGRNSRRHLSYTTSLLLIFRTFLLFPWPPVPLPRFLCPDPALLSLHLFFPSFLHSWDYHWTRN